MFSHTFILGFLNYVVPNLFLSSFYHSNQCWLSVRYEQSARFQEERYVHLPSSSVYRECDDELRLQVQGTVDVASLLSEYLFPSWQDMEGWSWCKKKQKHGDSSVPVANRKIRKSIAEFVRLAFQKICNTVTVMLGWVAFSKK